MIIISIKIKLGGKLDSSIVNGEGIRTVLFSTGCIHNCKGCQNYHLLNYNSGEDFSIDEIIKMLEKNEKITNKRVTFSGGDPFFQAKGFAELAKQLKQRDYNIWCYTGYTIEEIINSQNEDFLDLLAYVDVLVDGKFDNTLLKNAPKYAGSSNQRVIDVQSFFKNKQSINV